MKTFSSNVRYLLSLPEINFVYLVKTVTPYAVYLETTAPFDLSIPGLGVFDSSSSLASVDEMRMSKAVDRAIYKIVYVDPDFQKRALFEVGLTGSRITVYMCFFNPTENTIGNVDPGEPFTDPDDLLIIYSGKVDTQGYTIEPDEGTISAVIECASPMASLDLSKPYLTSKDALRAVNPNDTSFDQVTNSSSRATVLWGKV